jgi:hypothetical protein
LQVTLFRQRSDVLDSELSNPVFSLPQLPSLFPQRLPMNLLSWLRAVRNRRPRHKHPQPVKRLLQVEPLEPVLACEQAKFEILNRKRGQQ